MRHFLTVGCALMVGLSCFLPDQFIQIMGWLTAGISSLFLGRMEALLDEIEEVLDADRP